MTGCSIGRSVPAYAQMWADDANKQYVSPPCLDAHPDWRGSYKRLTTQVQLDSTWKTGRNEDRYWPNQRCADEEGFVEATQRWPFSAPPSRVNPDGTWKQ